MHGTPLTAGWGGPCRFSAISAYSAVEYTLREHFRVCFGEEGVVETADYLGGVVFLDHERQIYFGSALGDHADLRIFEQAENLGGDAGCLPKVLADQADDGFAAFVLHVGKFGEIRGQSGDCLVGLGGDRDRKSVV